MCSQEYARDCADVSQDHPSNCRAVSDYMLVLHAACTERISQGMFKSAVLEACLNQCTFFMVPRYL